MANLRYVVIMSLDGYVEDAQGGGARPVQETDDARGVGVPPRSGECVRCGHEP